MRSTTWSLALAVALLPAKETTQVEFAVEVTADQVADDSEDECQEEAAEPPDRAGDS